MGRAAGYGIRQAVLSLLGERRTATSKEIQAVLGEARSTVNDHLRQLCEDGLIVCVEQKATRGTIKRVYGPAGDSLWVSDDELEALEPKMQTKILFRQLRSALSDGSSAFSDPSRLHRRGEVFSAARAQLDQKGWSEMRAIHGRAVEEMERVREESGRRLRQGGAKPIQASSGIFFFELPPFSASD